MLQKGHIKVYKSLGSNHLVQNPLKSVEAFSSSCCDLQPGSQNTLWPRCPGDNVSLKRSEGKYSLSEICWTLLKIQSIVIDNETYMLKVKHVLKWIAELRPIVMIKHCFLRVPKREDVFSSLGHQRQLIIGTSGKGNRLTHWKWLTAREAAREMQGAQVTAG